ncbi:hypothetical protein D3C86_1758950 [compost metagenome]
MRKQRQPFLRAVGFPAFNQSGKRGTAIAFFFAQLARFATGQQIRSPAFGAHRVVLLAGAIQADEQRQIDAEKTLFHLLDLPALKFSVSRYPARFYRPFQPL